MADALAKDFYVYVGEHPKTGLPCYFGKGRNYRFRGHIKPLTEGRHCNRHLQAIHDLHGPIAWSKVRVGLTEEEAFATEVALIAYFGRGNNGILCNATDGGDGAPGHKPSQQTRLKMSASQRGKRLSLEHRESISAAAKHRIITEETRAKLAAAKLGKRRGPPSAETRAKRSAALKGRPGRTQSPEVRAKISASMTALRAAQRLNRDPSQWPVH